MLFKYFLSLALCFFLLLGCAGNSSNDSTTPQAAAPSGGGAPPPPPPPPVIPNVSKLYASPANFQITLRWTNPVATSLSGVRVIRKLGSFPTSRTDGTLISTIVTNSVNDSSLANGTTYYYGVYPYDAATNYASGMQISSVPYPSGTAVMSRSLTGGLATSSFYAITPDGYGNVYAVGYQTGTNTYTYGPGVTATGANSGGSQLNPVIVKYNLAGVAQWARTITSGFADAQFMAVTVDSLGNPIVAGYQTNSFSFTYGTGVTATGTSSANNAVIVKYNASGTAQWVRTVTSGSSSSAYSAAVCDSADNIYVAGFQVSTSGNGYGPGVSAFGSASGKNALIVKYDSSGVAQWARTTSTGPTLSEYLGLAVDALDGIFAVGYQTGNSTYTYGSGVTATSGTALDNSLIVKYSTAGLAQWARTIISGSSSSHFNGVVADGDGNLYSAGYQTGTSNFAYGVGVATTGFSTGTNAVLAKYSFDGNAQWVRSTQGGTGNSAFFSVAIDLGGNVYVSGYQTTTGTYSYYSFLSLTGTATASNPLIGKFSSTGFAQWGQTLMGGNSSAVFNYVSSDKSGNLFTAGHQNSTVTYTYGIGVLSTGPAASANNATIVKYVQ